MASENATCMVCGCDDTELPLISLQFQGKPLWICPKHMPVLIHDADKLVHQLPKE